MANSVPDLYDLRVTLTGPRYGVYRARYDLLECGPYPPPPRVEGNTVTFAAETRVLETAQAQIPAGQLDVAVLPPELGDVSALLDLTLLETMRGQWPRETVAERMRGVTGHLFQGPGEAMLQRLLEQTTPLPDFRSLGDPSTSSGQAFGSLGRVTLDIQSPTLRRVPWEMMALDDGEAGDTFADPSLRSGLRLSARLWRRCMILRRSQAPAGERSAPFDVPLTVAIRATTGSVQVGTGWGDGLFDVFTHRARDLGGIEWSETLQRPEKGEIHHLVYSSAEGLAPLLAAVGYAPVGRRLRGGSAAPRSPQYWGARGAPTQPRLLILHDVSAHIPPYLTLQLVYEALDRGADAVLLTAFDTVNPDAGSFFPTFYRKLMHNWPLDQCLLAALTAAAQHGVLPQGWAFGAREGGELRLLLTGVVVEAAQAAPFVAGPPPPPTQPGRVLRGGEPAPAPPGGAPTPPPPMAPKAPEPSVTYLSRQARAAADLEAQTRQAVEGQRQVMFTQVAKMASVSFEAEAAGVAEVVGAREQMREASRTVERAEEALESLAQPEVREEQSRVVRLTNLWLTEGGGGGGRAVTGNEALISNALYTLHLQIALRRLEVALVAAVFPDEALREVFEKHDKVTLDVMFFSPETDFELEHQRTTLELPRYGPSNEVRIWVRPRQAGQRRLRACIYYQNVLLQSVLLEATVIQPTEEAPLAAIVARMVDYAASTDLALLEELPQPALNIFTNQTPDGTHWIGVFSSEDMGELQLRAGDMHTFGADELAAMAEDTRELLAEIEGPDRVYRYRDPLPLDEEGKLKLDDESLQRKLETREKDLVSLAIRGWRMYYALFLGRGTLEMERRKNLHEALQGPGIVSIARCRGESTTIPWAALYDLPLDTGRPDRIRLCGVFREQLAANKWSNDMAELIEKHDLLDDPQTCRSNPQCPLSGPDRKRTVCPFGFWGFLHQVEQPLQQVKPVSVDEVPTELQRPQFNQTSFLMRPQHGDVRIAFGAYPDRRILNDLAAHRTEIETLGQNGSLQVIYEEDRDRVLALLEQGGQHLYYFFCHGERQDNVFMLKLGPSDNPGFISADNLLPFEIDWPDQPQPLVILNGCETMALTPELIHGFLSTLRELGASGAVGSEVKVWTPLAMPFGYRLMRQLLAGQSLGEAFLEARRNLLRQYNPLGLVYAYYAPATLHLHDPAKCDWCEVH